MNTHEIDRCDAVATASPTGIIRADLTGEIKVGGAMAGPTLHGNAKTDYVDLKERNPL